MKKFVLGFIIGALLFSFASVYAAGELNIASNPFPVFINGVQTEVDGYNINGYTYLKLRDFELAGLKVDFKDRKIYVDNNISISPNNQKIRTLIDQLYCIYILEDIIDVLDYHNLEMRSVIANCIFFYKLDEVSLKYNEGKFNDANTHLSNCFKAVDNWSEYEQTLNNESVSVNKIVQILESIVNETENIRDLLSKTRIANLDPYNSKYTSDLLASSEKALKSNSEVAEMIYEFNQALRELKNDIMLNLYPEISK